VHERLSSVRRHAAGVSIAAALLTACSTGPLARPARQPEPPADVPTRVSTLIADPHFDPVVGATWDALHEFWTRLAPQVATDAYASPARFNAYLPDEPPRVPCFITAWKGNAYYCGRDTSISVDREWLAAGIDSAPETLGVVPVAILAHEWGHHIQKVSGARFAGTVQRELEADCYAGLFVSDVILHPGRLTLEPQDPGRILRAFIATGDPGFERDEWFRPGLHGGARDRALAFAAGYITDEVRFCRSYEGAAAPIDLTLGPYLLTPLPASVASPLEGAAYEIVSAPFTELTAHVEYVPQLARPRAVAAIRPLSRAWLGPDHVKIGGVESFGQGILPGTAAVVRYEQRVFDDEGRVHVVHGALFLHAHAAGGGLVFDLFSPGPAPNDDAGWETIGDYLFVTVWGIDYGELEG
jgi:uncharacterized protein